MVLHENGAKLFIKVERGTKPRLKLYEDSHKALITIPYDHTTKWPVLKEQMQGGLTVFVQRLEQQYKIVVQHTLDRKPNVCVYVNPVANERNLKTCVKLINTQMSHIGVAGPNLEVTGTVKARKVTFESTFGALHTNAKLSARHVTLNAQHIFIKPEAMYACQILRMMSRKVQVDGKIYPLEKDTSFLNVFVDSALLHIGVDGIIGAFRVNSDKMALASSEVIAELLVLQLKGSLANYGKIVSKISIDMQVDGSVLSLEDGRIDSAGRGYEALKQIKGITSETSASLPTSSKLSKAIVSQSPDTVAQLLEDGVDPNDLVSENSSRCTPKKVAAMKYREIRATQQRNKLREKITVIQALMVTHDWRRGSISSSAVTAKIGRDCEDCAQFRAETLELSTLGSARCENDSIWTCGSVLLYISNDLVIEGQVKNHDFTVHCGGNTIVQQDGIVSQENYAKINCSALFSSGIWSVGEHINIEAATASFFENAYLEGEIINIKLADSCHHGGTWQTKYLELEARGTMQTSHEGKVLVDETAKVFARSFNCGGVWKVAESLQINVKESANLQPSSLVNANLLKLIDDGCCVVSGHINAEHLLSYVRNDLITAASGRIVIGISGTVATGAFRNDGSWLSDCNLHLHAACFEQSEDAIIYAKDTLDLAIYDDSVNKSHGRIVAGYCTMRINQKVRLDGYTRVHHLEIYLPYPNESQCVVGGQLEVSYGPVIVKGRSEFLPSQPLSLGHKYPGFILEGQLKAEAIVAPFVAVRLDTASYALLSGMSSVAESPYKALASVGALHTMRASFIDSASNNNFPEAVICASNWIHEGQLRFKGSTAYIITDSFVNRGRLTSGGRLQNHMKSVYVSVSDRFENESVFSADSIQISGNGELENRNRIFATDRMQIHLSNFSNENGQMEPEKIKLLSAGKDWTKISGRIDATTKPDITASKLSVVIKDFDIRKQMRLSARAQLRVSNDIVDQQATVSFEARDAVIFDRCKVVTESIDLNVGEAYETEVIVSENSLLQGNYLRVSGKCNLLTLVTDGIIDFDSIIFDDSIRNVKVTGKGTLKSRSSLNFDGKTAVLSLTELQASEILGTSIKISPILFVKITPVKNTTATTVYADHCAIDGRLFVEGKLNLKSSNGVIRIDGDLIGTTLMSEMSVEANDVLLVGNVLNLEFLEIYARKRFDYCDTAIMDNTKNIAIEAESVAFDGTLSNFDTIIVTAEEILVEGNLTNSRCGSSSMFGRTVRFEGTANGLSRLEINGRNDAYIAGTISGISHFAVDGKWITCNSNISDCKKLNFASYSSVLDGNIHCDNFSASALGAIFLYCSVEARLCHLSGAFVTALNTSSTIPVDSNVSALIYIADDSSVLKDLKKICTRIFFVLDAAGREGSRDQWSNTIDIIQQSFQSPTINCNEMLCALENEGQLQASTYYFPLSSGFYRQMRQLADRFRVEHASVFNAIELLELMRQQTGTLSALQDAGEYESGSSFETNGLSEAVNDVRTRLLKYTLQSPQSSIDDYGYGSRSSSEDIDERFSYRASPSISVTKCEDRSGASTANAIYEQVEDEMDGCHQYLSVPGSISVSNDGSSVGKSDEELDKENEMNFVYNGDHKVPIVHINFDCFDVAVPKPKFETSRHPAPTADLAMKKLQVKSALSNLDLRTFGSESSLASFGTVELATPVRIVRSPLRRSLIPRSSFRQSSTVGI